MRRSYGLKILASLPIVIVIASLSQSFAQTQPSDAQKTSPGAPMLPDLRHGDPQSDTQKKPTATTFGDWVLKCQADGQDAKICELTQLVIEKEKKAPFAQIAVGRLKSDQPLQVTLVAPTNVSFGSAARIVTDDKDPHPVDLGWARCFPNACYASAQLKDDILKSWVTKTQVGRILYLNGAGQVTAIPISFKGLGQATEALNKMK